ncbi:MAG: YIP1 family protein [Verrucomicrobiae bacterium]|nr:YIP1 family protein [Verrucomicrobiae bacterium]
MIKAILLLLEPARTWDKIAREARTKLSILLVFLLPWLALTCAAEGYALVRWGKVQGPVKTIKKFTPAEAVGYETLQCVLSIALVFVGAKLLQSVAVAFNSERTYNQAFTTVAYGLCPLFLARFLDMHTHMSPWVSWGIGMSLSLVVLYQGVLRVMQPAQPQVLGLFISGAIVLTMAAAAVRLVTALTIAGKFKNIHTLFLDAATRLGL